MTQRILTTCLFLLLAVVAKSQSPDFQYRGIDPTNDCKSVMEYKVVAPLGTATYAWDFGDGNTGTGSVATHIYATSGTYDVTLTADGDAANAKKIAVVVPPFDHFVAYRDNTAPDAGTFKYKIGSPLFSAAGTYTFNWAITGPDGTVVDPASSTWEFIHTFPSSGNFNVAFTVTSSFGCTSTNNRIVAVTDTVVVPNVFTPDGDGVNDVWSIKSNGKDKLTVKVYSRAGVLVYEEHAAVILWDGKTAYGKDLASGVYYYVVDRDDKVLPAQKGFFYLLRGK